MYKIIFKIQYKISGQSFCTELYLRSAANATKNLGAKEMKLTNLGIELDEQAVEKLIRLLAEKELKIEVQAKMILSQDKQIDAQAKMILSQDKQIDIQKDMLNIKQNIIESLNETIDKMVEEQSIEKTAEEEATKYWFN